jgi:ribosomal protein S7
MSPTTYMILRSALATARSHMANGKPLLADRVISDAYDLITAKQREEHPEPPPVEHFETAFRKACARGQQS